MAKSFCPRSRLTSVPRPLRPMIMWLLVLDLYTTYAMGNGAFSYEDIGVKVPYEMARDPKTNGGEDLLYMRQRKVFAPFGLSYEKKTQASTSPTAAELETSSDYSEFNDYRYIEPSPIVGVQPAETLGIFDKDDIKPSSKLYDKFWNFYTARIAGITKNFLKKIYMKRILLRSLQKKIRKFLLIVPLLRQGLKKSS